MKIAAFILLSASSAAAFAPMPKPTMAGQLRTSELRAMTAPYYIDLVEEPQPALVKAESPKKNTVVKRSPTHKEGVFSPIVYWAKELLGENMLNTVRGKFISVHSDAIKSFVSTADSDSGTKVLKILFKAADTNNNGKIEEEELEAALKILGFKWLQEKQIKGIFARAGGADKGYITLEEWMAEAPKTLKTNLVKLAKTNGGDMGLLV